MEAWCSFLKAGLIGNRTNIARGVEAASPIR